MFSNTRLLSAGSLALLDDDKIDSELEDLMREYMELSGQHRFFGHRTNLTDKGLRKLARSHTDRRGIKYDVYYATSVQLRGQSPSCDQS